MLATYLSGWTDYSAEIKELVGAGSDKAEALEAVELLE
jgi:hypothetical protein